MSKNERRPREDGVGRQPCSRQRPGIQARRKEGPSVGISGQLRRSCVIGFADLIDRGLRASSGEGS